jgi:probable F420-dependent oxidoreductase
MQIGAVYPQTELGGDPTAVGQIGRAVEELGFAHLLAYDHVLGAVHADRAPRLTGPYTEQHPFHDPFVMFAYLAGITERIQFATGVLILPQRQTALVARQAADVDLLSRGRLRLGVGVGWSHVEYEALGQDFHTRGARQEEQIGLLRRLFTEPVVDFSGRFDRIDRAALVPKPARPIPIWLGGSSEAAFDRAARLADGFIFIGGSIEAPSRRGTGCAIACVTTAGRSRTSARTTSCILGGHGRPRGRGRWLARGRWDTCLGAHHGSWLGLRRLPHRVPHLDRRRAEVVAVTSRGPPSRAARQDVGVHRASAAETSCLGSRLGRCIRCAVLCRLTVREGPTTTFRQMSFQKSV